LAAELGGAAFRNAIIEVGLLTVMIVALVAALFRLRRQPAGFAATAWFTVCEALPPAPLGDTGVADA
jgi:hypothetical protein